MAETSDERAAFGSLIAAIVEEQGAEALARSLDPVADRVAELLDQVPEREGMPRELVRAIAGGIQATIQRRLPRDEDEELSELTPQLWDWVLSHPVPPGPIEVHRPPFEPLPFEQRQAHSSSQERILRALAAVVAEKGYPDTTVADVVDRASTSQRSFYAHFKNKEDAVLAALEGHSSRMLAAALPPFRNAPDWGHAVHDTITAMLAFSAEEPEYARLGSVEPAGRPRLDQSEMVIEGMEGLLAPGYERNPDAPPIAAEAAGGSLYSLLREQIEKKGPERLPELVPTLSYLTLAPFLGGEDAYKVSIG